MRKRRRERGVRSLGGEKGAEVHAGPAKFEFGDDEFVDWVDGQAERALRRSGKTLKHVKALDRAGC